MKIKLKYKTFNGLFLGFLFLFFAVLLGAFGSHILEGRLSSKAMDTYRTGLYWHVVYSLVLCLLGALQISNLVKAPKIIRPALILTFGTLFFSGNCYLYAFTGIKIFALLVPFGGMAFLIGTLWLAFIF